MASKRTVTPSPDTSEGPSLPIITNYLTAKLNWSFISKENVGGRLLLGRQPTVSAKTCASAWLTTLDGDVSLCLDDYM
jgi:hypothetical protein